MLEARERAGKGDDQGGGGEDAVRGVFGLFLVWGTAGGVQPIGRQQTRTVSEGRGKGLLISRGVSRRVVRIGVQGRGGSDRAMGYAVSRAGGRCEFDRRIS